MRDSRRGRQRRQARCTLFVLLRRDVRDALPVLRKELCCETSALERESASTRRAVFGFGLGFARVGVDDPEVDAAAVVLIAHNDPLYD